MADENTEQADAGVFAEQQAKGAPPGVRNKDLSEGQSHDSGIKAPVISNEAPVKVPTAEEKAAADKVIADKKVADDAAAAAAAETPEAKDAKEKAVKDAADAEAAKAGEYMTYGNEAADGIVEILKESGVAPAEAKAFFEKATASGKIEDIDLKGLTDKVGKTKASLIMMGVKEYVNTVVKTNTEIVNATHAAAGGRDNFVKVSDWAAAKEKTDPAFKAKLDEYRKMFGTGPTGAALASSELVKAFNSAPENVSLQVKMTTGDKSGGQSDAPTGISRADYIEKLKAAETKGDKAEIARLHAARLAGKKAGI